MRRGLPPELPAGAEAFELEPGRILFVLPNSVPVDLSSLSAAERDVTCRLLDGHGNERIARDRGTSIRTVANQVASIFRKLNVSSRSELSALLYRPPSA